MENKKLKIKYQNCIACSSSIKLLGAAQSKQIFVCPKCGLGATFGPGRKTQYHDYHRDKVYIKATDQFRNIFQKRLDIISKIGSKGKVLEIGSSTGLFLSLMHEKGWEVLGIEPSATSSAVARRRDIPVLNTTFELANLKIASFDVMIFNHVLEHMESPIEVLRKARKLLRKDGIIFIDVPNFASLTARVRKTGWKYLLPKEHRWHFTPTSLFLLLEKTGFAPVYWEAHSGIWGYGSPYLELWQSFKGIKKRFISNILTALPTWFLTKLKVGTGLTVVAQKLGGE